MRYLLFALRALHTNNISRASPRRRGTGRVLISPTRKQQHPHRKSRSGFSSLLTFIDKVYIRRDATTFYDTPKSYMHNRLIQPWGGEEKNEQSRASGRTY